MAMLKILLAIVSSLLLLVALLLTGLCYEIDRTLLNPAFVSAELEQADMISLMKSALMEELPADAQSFAPAIAATIEQQRPWLLQQARRAVDDTYAYLLGKSDQWQLAFERAPFRQALMQNVQAQLQKNPPADYQKLSAEQKKQCIAGIEATVDKIVLPEKFDLSTLDAEQRSNVVELRGRIKTFQTTYSVLLAADVLLSLLLLWSGSSILMAIIALIAGLGLHVLMLLSSGLAALLPPDYATHLPAGLSAYLPTFYAHLGAPLRAYAWGCLLGALFFLVLGLVLRSVRRSFATKAAVE